MFLGMLEAALPDVLDPGADSFQQRLASVSALMQSIGRHITRHVAAPGAHVAAWRAHWLLCARAAWARRDRATFRRALDRLGDPEAVGFFAASDGSVLDVLDEDSFALVVRARSHRTSVVGNWQMT